jgi:hypothetical protein
MVLFLVVSATARDAVAAPLQEGTAAGSPDGGTATDAATTATKPAIQETPSFPPNEGATTSPSSPAVVELPPPRPLRRRIQLKEPRRLIKGALGVAVGYSHGGDELLRAMFAHGEIDNIYAGAGGHVSIDFMATPFWIGEAVGFGLGAEAGVKGDSIEGENATFSFVRFPLRLTGHAFISTPDDWYVVPRVGIFRDFQPRFSAEVSGSKSQVDLEGVLGGFFGLSGYWVLGERLGLSAGLHMSLGSYKGADGAKVGANNVGFSAGIHLHF